MESGIAYSTIWVHSAAQTPFTFTSQDFGGVLAAPSLPRSKAPRDGLVLCRQTPLHRFSMTVWKRHTFELEQAGLQVNCAEYDKSGRFGDKDQIYQTYISKHTDNG